MSAATVDASVIAHTPEQYVNALRHLHVRRALGYLAADAPTTVRRAAAYDVLLDGVRRQARIAGVPGVAL